MPKVQLAVHAPDGKSELATQVSPPPHALAQEAALASGCPPPVGRTPNGGKDVVPASRRLVDGQAHSRGRTSNGQARQEAFRVPTAACSDLGSTASARSDASRLRFGASESENASGRWMATVR
jgi:hypothetical protein